MKSISASIKPLRRRSNCETRTPHLIRESHNALISAEHSFHTVGSAFVFFMSCTEAIMRLRQIVTYMCVVKKDWGHKGVQRSVRYTL